MTIAERYRDPDWAAAHRIDIDTTTLCAASVGDRHGVTEPELAGSHDRARVSHDALMARREGGELPFFDLPAQDTVPVHSLAAHIRDRFDNYLLIGIGGSSLGPKAAQQALCSPWHNLMEAGARSGPRMFFIENVDPSSLLPLLNLLDPSKTCVNVVTKSGGTAETLANFMVVRAWLEKAGCNLSDHLIATTDPKSGDLRRVADEEGWASLPVPPGVGGRFSQLTAVGLLPAAVAGIDIDELLAGAADMSVRCAAFDLKENPAWRLAALYHLLDVNKGKPICVMMPYADGLTYLADWFVQLWAESLGKAEDLDGNPVHTGQTPLAAVGAIDQHSQLQLFVEGPNDKLVTFLKVASFDDPGDIPSVYADVPSMGYLGGHTLAELLNAEQAATREVLTRGGRPNACITIPRLNPFAMGQLFYLFEAMTAFAGGLYRVNPFDQPGVEHGKRLTYGAMGRKGY